MGALLAYEEDSKKHVALANYAEYKAGHGMHVDLIMVAKTHRRYGIAPELFKQLVADITKRGYTDLFGITIVRSKNHPLKPAGALELDAIAPRAGFKPIGLYEVWNWPTRCGVPGNEFVAPVDNTVQYWHKRL